MVDPHDKIAAIVDSKELDSKKVGAAAKDATDDDYKTSTSITKELERVRDNVKFYNKIQEKPVLTKKYDKSIFTSTVLNLNHYIRGQAWPESIFNIDKLLRLNTSASYEWQKRFLRKKRGASYDFMPFLIIIIIVFVAILAVWILLPRFM